ncbi:hypothetical protein TBLA_0D05530 [Henningerozyma blattae CBS 6284]|uniref:GATA-type domain-containing protein n=1 Tax=Henningerozyma blattae (strain ATCC 34711 / CBS 6284 / DSM 70876 / NBRC 10599 / NRRL Y-10934 / UCD 77-7) TaxID=1071380 RepID=I2H3U3_HENB6|nr:hypothetical protein TBLA_0D05530 [Tetrapisispora blattae CBS 6284]CCH61045.1 hypothetical protein TBLA_0D05530 [Tetrapisispora blattae CBS 6284]
MPPISSSRSIHSIIDKKTQHKMNTITIVSSNTTSAEHTQANGTSNASLPNSQTASQSPICKNCFTTNTPLWRRDENGSILCNACGLFLKLHGKPRPISLKTDVIKSRNRKNISSSATNTATNVPTTTTVTPSTTTTTTSNSTSPSPSNGLTAIDLFPSVKKRKLSISKTISKSNNPNTAVVPNASTANSTVIVTSNTTSNTTIIDNSESSIISTPPPSHPPSTSINNTSTATNNKISVVIAPKPNLHLSNSLISNSDDRRRTFLPRLSSLLDNVTSTPTDHKPILSSINNTLHNTLSNSSLSSTQNTNPIIRRKSSDALRQPRQTRNNNTNSSTTSTATTNNNSAISINRTNSNSNIHSNNQINKNNQPTSSPSSASPITTGTNTSINGSIIPPNILNSLLNSNTTAITNSQTNLINLPFQENLPLSINIQYQENLIKLNSRINELEIMNDLYRKYIFNLDEKCKDLEKKLQEKE